MASAVCGCAAAAAAASTGGAGSGSGRAAACSSRLGVALALVVRARDRVGSASGSTDATARAGDERHGEQPGGCGDAHRGPARTPRLGVGRVGRPRVVCPRSRHPLSIGTRTAVRRRDVGPGQRVIRPTPWTPRKMLALHNLGTVMARTPATRVSVGFVLLLSALTALGPFTFDTYLAAFPEIADDLNTTAAAVQLTIAASLAGLALGQLPHRVRLRRLRPPPTAARLPRRVRAGVRRARARAEHHRVHRPAVRAGLHRRRRDGPVAGGGPRQVRGARRLQGDGPPDARRRRRADPGARPSAPSCCSSAPGG